jgi:hypothetical protein
MNRYKQTKNEDVFLKRNKKNKNRSKEKVKQNKGNDEDKYRNKSRRLLSKEVQ